MVKIIVISAVLAIAIGTLVALTTGPTGSSTIGGVIRSGASPESTVPQPLGSVSTQISGVDRISTEIALLNLLESSISERNKEYEQLVSEITRLKTIRDTLQAELGEVVFVPAAAIE